MFLASRSNLRERRCNRITPAQINAADLTHLFFAYASIDPGNFSVLASHPEDIGLYEQFTSRKTSSLQTWIAVGGFDFSSLGPNHETWKSMTSSDDGRTRFITSLEHFMALYGFQGVDLDWQYPSAPDRGGSSNDAVNFVALVREMRQAWGNKYGISATLPADYWYLRGYDPKGMEQYVDFFGFMSYDLHGPWDSDANTWGSVVRPHTDIREIQNDTVALWFDSLAAMKINLGMALYGRGYTLADSKCAHSGCKFVGPSKPGACTNSAGLLSLVEITDLVKQKGLKPEVVPETMSKQLTWDDQWIGYDDEETFKMKTDWATRNCFGGIMVWSADLNSGEGSGSTPDNVGSSTGSTQPSGSTQSRGTSPSSQSAQSLSSGHGPIQTSQSNQVADTTHTNGVVSSSLLNSRSGSSKPTQSGVSGQFGHLSSSGSSSQTSGSTSSNKVNPSVHSGQPTTSGRSSSSGQPSTPVQSSQSSHLKSSGQPSQSSGSSRSGTSTQSVHSGPSGTSEGSSQTSTTARSNGNPQSISSGHVGGSSRSTTSRQSSGSVHPEGSTKPNQPQQLTQSSQSSLSMTTTGNATAPGPTIDPGLIIVAGGAAVLAMIPLGIGIANGLEHAQESITSLRQSNSPSHDDVKHTLEVLAAAGVTLSILTSTITGLHISSLPDTAKPIIQNLTKNLPQIEKGVKDTITDLTDAVKDPKNVNKDGIRKADQLLGKQGSLTQQVTQAFKQLTDWKPSQRIGDITLPNQVTLPSPTFGDNWKGTTIQGTLTVPSPSVNWDKPPSTSHSGFDIMDALKGLGKQAEGAVTAAASSIVLMSGLGSTSVTAFGDLVGLLTGAVEDVGGLGAGLDGIELDTLDAAGVPRVVDVQNANRALYTELSDTLNEIAQFITRPPQGLQSLKKRAPAYLAGGAVLGLLAKGPSAVIGFQPQTKASQVSPAPSQPTETDASKEEYILSTVPGTTVEAFQKFIADLPDKGIGSKIYCDWPTMYQYYTGKMTLEEALIINRAPIVNAMGPNTMRKSLHSDQPSPKRTRWMGESSRERSNGTRLNSRDESRFDTRPDSALHLRMLSADPLINLGHLWHTLNDPQYDYRYEESLGKGMTVYVLDAAFDLSHSEFIRGYDLVPQIYVPPNYSTDIGSGSGDHGTRVASLVVGNRLGVASQAILVAVKDANSQGNENWKGITEAWRWIINDVKTKGRQGKAVLLGTTIRTRHFVIPTNRHVDYARWNVIEPEYSDLTVQLLADCWDADIVTVFVAGNAGDTLGTAMGQSTPQRFANPRNPLIIVGSVGQDGQKSWFNMQVAPALNAQGRDLMLTGDITLYALGEDVDLAFGAPDHGYGMASGTSFAAPQIAGLAAYALGLPDRPSLPPGTVALTVKNLIVGERRLNTGDGADIAYNSARGVLCPDPNLPPRSLGMGKIIDRFYPYFKRYIDPKNSDPITFQSDFVVQDRIIHFVENLKFQPIDSIVQDRFLGVFENHIFQELDFVVLLEVICASSIFVKVVRALASTSIPAAPNPVTATSGAPDESRLLS
ncbi:MAG: hypothetical protein Q9170_005645 [Blastenia crenularia]